MVPPVGMIALHRIRQPFRIEHKLVHLKTIRVGVVRLRFISVGRSGEIQRGLDPSVKLRTARHLVDCRHQWIAVGVRLPDHGRTTVRPVRIRERRRIERGWQTSPWRRCRSRRCSRPILTVKLRQAGKKSLRLGAIRRRPVWHRMSFVIRLLSCGDDAQ